VAERRFEEGETIVHQEVWRGRVWAARPMRVVEDRGDFLALWFPRRTRWKVPRTPPTRARPETRAERFAAMLEREDWVLRDFEWDVDSLWLMRPGSWHAVRVGWRDEWEPWGWYVNLEQPARRTARGVQTMDLMLDVIVEPEGTWRWKDEDELDALVQAGLFDAATAARVRDEALAVIRRVEAGAAPFRDRWHDWRPDPGWRLPELPPGWDQP
jgi:hypothetical protein